jgi:hypothetical protein
MTRRNTGFRSAPVLPMGAAIVLVVVAGCASHGDLAANAGTPSGKGLAANDMRPTAGGVVRVTVGDLTRTPSEDVLCSPTAVPSERGHHPRRDRRGASLVVDVVLIQLDMQSSTPTVVTFTKPSDLSHHRPGMTRRLPMSGTPTQSLATVPTGPESFSISTSKSRCTGARDRRR